MSATADLKLFRIYEPHELGDDGYPHAWHGCCGDLEHDPRGGIKDMVRAEADHRCLRCGHPYTPGCGEWGTESAVDSPIWRERIAGGDWEATSDVIQSPRRSPLWSPCDEQCTHEGPLRCLVDGRVAWQDADGAKASGPPSRWMDDRATVQAAWRILTVHHLNERKHDLRWWNLAALCQRCHLYVQRKVQMERVYPWEHTDWFKPFAAGWYAYAYLGENLTREQALERQDELLGLERAA